MRDNHAEMGTPKIARFLPVHYGNHTVQTWVASLVFVVHEGEFEIFGVLGLLLRVWAVVKPVDNIRASAKFIVECVRVDSAVAGSC